MVLVARRGDRLQTIADQYKNVEVLTADLLTTEGVAAVEARLRDTTKPPVDFVVNNAGFGTSGPMHRIDPNRYAAVRVAHSNLPGLQRLHVEADRIGGGDHENAPDHFGHFRGCSPRGRVQIDVPCGSAAVDLPERQECCSLEHEPVGMVRDSEPIEKPLGRKLREHCLKLGLTLGGDARKPRPHRIGAFGIAADTAHATLSR